MWSQTLILLVLGAPSPSLPVAPGPGPKASDPRGWWKRGAAACGPGGRLRGGQPSFGYAVCQDARGLANGPHIVFDWKTGTCLEQSTWRHGKRHGQRIQYHRNGLPKRLETYQDGRFDGPVLEWYPDGRPRSEATFRGYRLEGRFRAWHPSGALAEVGHYRAGKPVGPSHVTFHANGQKKEEIAYQGGVPHGVRTRWDASGVRRSEERYVQGVRDGLWATWHPSGARESVASYRRGRPHGLHRRWDARGRLVEMVHWGDGRVVSEAGGRP